MQVMYLVAWLCSDPTGGAYNTDRICTPEKKLYKMLHVYLCTCETLTDLQILGCELHQNAFGGRAPPGPGPARGAIALP